LSSGRELVDEQRARFDAGCSVFEDLAAGLGTGRDRCVVKSLRALDWLLADDA
jgi:hypothetical protein